MSDSVNDPLFSCRTSAGSRTYFFDVKVAADCTRHLVVSESRQVGERWECTRIMVFEEHLETFLYGLHAASEFLKTAERASPAPEVPADGVGAKTYSLEEIRGRHPHAYERWTDEDDQLLFSLRQQGIPISELARRFQRQDSAIRSRLSKLEGGRTVLPPKG